MQRQTIPVEDTCIGIVQDDSENVYIYRRQSFQVCVVHRFHFSLFLQVPSLVTSSVTFGLGLPLVC